MAQLFIFGACRNILGSDTLELDLDELQIKSVAELNRYLEREYSELSTLNSLAIAVNEEYAPGDHVLKNTDVIALIPPVSGG